MKWNTLACTSARRKGERRERKEKNWRKAAIWWQEAVLGWRTFPWKEKKSERLYAHTYDPSKRQLRHDMGSLMLARQVHSLHSPPESTFMICSSFVRFVSFRMRIVSASKKHAKGRRQRAGALLRDTLQHIPVIHGILWRFIVIVASLRS